MVSMPSASSVQVRLSSIHTCGSVVVPAPVSSALAEISNRIFCSVSLGKYVSVAAAMTIADEKAASRSMFLPEGFIVAVHIKVIGMK